MNVLITGANGFIGRRLAGVLARGGHAVTGLDRAAQGEPGRAYIQADITDAAAMDAAFAGGRVDVLIHLAALVHKAGEDLSRDQYDRINHRASAVLFDLAARHGVKTLLFASTIEVYGEREERVITEQTPCVPRSYYAQAKYAAEQALLARKGAFDRWAVLRFAPVYAPDFRLNLDKRFYLPGKAAAYYFKDASYAFHFCAADNIPAFIGAFLADALPSGTYILSDEKPVAAKDFIALEKQRAGLKRAVWLPYAPCYAAIAAMEGVSRLVAKSEPFFSRYNFRKLFRSTVYDSAKARAVTGAMRYGIADLYADGPD